MRIVPRFSSDQAGLHRLSRSLSRDPLANVGIAIRQRNANRFALSEKSDAVLAGQSHILQVEHDATTFRFRADERLQLGNMVAVDPAAQCKDHLAVRLSVNSKQFSSPVSDSFVKDKASQPPIAGH